jgi:hypothetical protein
MRKQIIYSSACLIFAGAGFLGYHWAHRAEPARQGAVSTQAHAPRGASPSSGGDGDSDLGAPAVSTAPQVATASGDGDGLDRVSMAPGAASSGEHFPDTAVGRALNNHLRILVDVSPGADDRKQRSLEELRSHAPEASQALLDAYHGADPADTFGRWLISLTLAELDTNDSYGGLNEIATSAIPAGLKDTDREGSALANESAIRQNAAAGLAVLARRGNPAAEHDLLSLALSPPSGDEAVRTAAIKGYLAAGTDYEARVQALKAQLPSRYHDVVTLTVSQPEPAFPPDRRPANHKNGG